MSSSVHIDNKTKDILIIGKGPTQGLDNTTLTAEAEYSIIYSRSQRKFCLSLCYDGGNNFCSLMPKKYIKSKQKTLQQNHIHCI